MMHNEFTSSIGQSSAEAAVAGAEERCRVLVVDDDRSLLATLEAILAEHVDVVTCTSGEQALRLLASSRFHLVCSDFGMPGINGAEFLERVSALPYFVSTLLITGSDQYIRSPRTDHHYYVILKPFEPDRLVRLVLQLARLARMKCSVRSLRDSVAPPSMPPSAPPSDARAVTPPSSREREEALPSSNPPWRRR